MKVFSHLSIMYTELPPIDKATRLASILAPDLATDISNIANFSTAVNIFVSFHIQSHKLVSVINKRVSRFGCSHGNDDGRRICGLRIASFT